MKLEKLLVLGCVALGMALTGCAPADDGDDNTDCNPFVDLDCDPGTGGADKLQVSGTIATTTTWTLSQCPVRITGDLYIEGASNPVLTIPAGCEVRIDAGFGIYVSYTGAAGGLKALGTADKPVIFTSSKPTKSAGDWQDISIYANASDGDVRFENVFVEYGGGGGAKGAIYVDDAKPTFSNVFVTDSASDGLYFEDEGAFSTTSATLTMTDNAGFGVSLKANAAASFPETGSSFAANAFGAVEVRGGTITQSGTWADLGALDAYIVIGDVYVEGAGTPVLTVGAGTTVKVNPGYGFYISYTGAAGGFMAQGTSAAPVLFTTSAPTPAAGGWDGINIYANASDGSLRFEYATIEYAGETADGGLYVDDAIVTVISSNFRQSGSAGIYFEDDASFGAGSTEVVAVFNATYGVSLKAQAAGSIPETASSYMNNQAGAVQVRGGTIITSTTWGDIGLPYIVTQDLYVEGVASPMLTIDAGITVAFAAGIGLYVSYTGSAGGLTVNDDAMKPPTTFTSSAASPSKGDWDGIAFYDVTMNTSVLNDVVVNYAGGGGAQAAIYVDDAKPTFNGVVVKNSASFGIATSCGTAGNGPTLTNVTYGAGGESNNDGNFDNSGC